MEPELVRMAFGLRTVLLVLALPAALRAGEATPLQQPQWIATLSQEVLVYDYIAASADPTTVRLPDGGAVTVTTGNQQIVLRRYAADGAVARARAATASAGPLDVVLRATPANDAFYVLAGGSQSEALLMRFDADLQPEWQVTLPYEAMCQGDDNCLRLEVLADGSALAMRAFRLMRVGADSQVHWSVTDPNATAYFMGGDLAVDSAAIWVATSGGNSFHHSTARLSRLDFDGLRLSADVSSCDECGGVVINDIDLTSDGAHVVGNVGSPAGEGFFARYDALGYRLSWSASDRPGAYWRLVHDAGGAAYVLAGTTPWSNEVRRVDPATGTTLWSARADDLVARAAGVVTILRTPSAIEASALDAAGTASWRVPLTASNGGDSRVASRPAAVGGSVELLVSDLTPSDDPCATYPRLVRLDGAGTPSRFPLPCRGVETSGRVFELDASPAAGVLVNTLTGLTLYSPNGDVRWRLQACAWCMGLNAASQWPAAALANDGGAWAVRWDRPSLALPDGRTTIQRFDANGNLVVEVGAVGSAHTGYIAMRLLPGTDDVVMLREGLEQTLTWQRVGNDGTDLGSRVYAIPDYSYRIKDARRLPDGGTSVLVMGNAYCPGVCEPHYMTVLRLAADGTLVWRYQFPEDNAPWIDAALGADGGAAAVLPSYGTNRPLHMRVIDSAGKVGDDMPLAAIDPYARPWLLTATPDARWLLSTQSNTDGAYWLLDGAGQVTIERHDSPYPQFLQASAVGHLTTGPHGTSILLLDPHTLADRAVFDNPAGEFYGPRTWRLLDDGSVYGTIKRPAGGYQAIARYSAPGGVRSDVIFRDGLD